MPLVDMKDMLHHAYHNRYAVGAFDLVSLDFLQAILVAAESVRAPVILSLAESSLVYSDFELMMAAMEVAAQRAHVPVAIQLDHGASLDSAVKAIRLGANGVMAEAFHESLFRNIDQTRAMVDMAHACGVPVEGELGYVPEATGTGADHGVCLAQYTTLAEAKGFVERTGVDFLAVSIGTVHGRVKDKPKLDWGRLKEINAALGIPLVIHGGTGLSDDQFRKLITLGVAKINYRTAVNEPVGERLRNNVKQNRHASYVALQSGVREAIVAAVESRMRTWGSAGRAAEVLAQCRPWLNTEHVVVYNAPHLDESKLRALMAEGQRVLSSIPGVRAVQVGSVADKSTRYRHCWLIRLASSTVIDSYKQHPAQIAFTDRLFGPVASDRITASYRIVNVEPGAAVLPLSLAPVTVSVPV
ncbi:MAG: class II fructose-bisphosphate aldolase [Acidiferrobacter sp.]